MSIYETNTHEPDEDPTVVHPDEEGLYYGVIAGFTGHPMSGLAQVLFEDGTFAHISSGFGLRNMASAFGSLEAAVGQEISYSVDFFGVMEGFTPALREDD